MSETLQKITNVTEFEQYKIANAHIRFENPDGTLGTAQALGCTGTLTVEPETKTIQKLCAGEVLKEATKLVKLNNTISAHLSPEVAIQVFGLKNDGLKVGVYGYDGKKTARGVITLDVYDMYEEQKMLIAFPVVTFTAGLTINIESGGEEVAMLELTFSGLKDDNGYFYYQAYEADVTDPLVIETWHTNFDEALVALSDEPAA